MKKTYYGNELIKDLEEIIAIFELYEKSGVLHHQDMMKLKVYLTPPTSDEVCKALSEELEDNVWFKNNNFYTGYMNEIDTLASWHNGRVIVGHIWRPHLITLIGRFYEGMEKGEEK